PTRRSSDLLNTAQLTRNVAVEIVAKSDLVDRAIGGNKTDHHQETGTGFLNINALIQNDFRQARLDALDRVLHVHRSLARIGPGLEGRGNIDETRRVRGRFEIDQVVDAVELVFDQAGDALIDFLRRGTRICRVDADLWRRDVGILRDRQHRDRDDTAEHD